MKYFIYKCLDGFFLVRPILFFPVWIFFLCGWWGAKRAGLTSLPLNRSLGLMAAVTALMAAVYVLNQIQDVATDRANGRKFLIATGHISRTQAWVEAGLLISASFIWSFWGMPKIFPVFVLLLAVTGWMYNFPPLTWKNRPVGGMVANGLGGVLIYTLGWYAGGGSGWPVQAWLYGLACVSVSLYTTLPDRKGDAETGKITVAVKYGARGTALIAFFFELVVLVISLLIRDWLLAVPALLVFPLFVYAQVKPGETTILKATQFSVLGLSVSVAVRFPWIVILFVLTFYATRVYYLKRLHFLYPDFQKSNDA
ncbi:MAG: UbiA family prenyltransferase [candidate division KSB1 bacterium]|nr:UbiA family prenyltransferase [candidate division KSB1 bacterium]